MGIETIITAAALAGAGASAYASHEQAKAQKEALRQQEAAKPPPPPQQAKAPEEFREANRKRGLLGVSGTLLNGVSGIPPGLLNTGRTLLGS